MTTYRLRIAPRSGFMTPVQADTIFGHLAWAWRFRNGEDSLTDWLKEFQSNPPFLLSDGFPSGYLPAPRLFPTPADTDHIAERLSGKAAGIDGRNILGQIAKQIKKTPFLPEEFFRGAADGGLEYRRLAEAIIDILPGVRTPDPSKTGRYLEIEGFDGLIRIVSPGAAVTVQTMKNVIDRRTSTVGIGGLFSIQETFYDHGIDIWVELRSIAFDEFRVLLEDVEAIGYGKRKSAGQGQFRIVSFEPAELPHTADASHFLSLSGFVPAANDPRDGAYSVRVKRGKIGENWAAFGSFLKKPLFMLEPGSFFRIDGDRREYYGSFLDDVHSRPEIRHYAYALPLFVKVA